MPSRESKVVSSIVAFNEFFFLSANKSLFKSITVLLVDFFFGGDKNKKKIVIKEADEYIKSNIENIKKEVKKSFEGRIKIDKARKSSSVCFNKFLEAILDKGL